MITTFAKTMGLLLIILGAIAFIPNFVSSGLLFGTFRVDFLHNVINIVAGIMLATAGFSDNWEASRRVSFIIAGLYGILAIVGFISSTGVVLGMPMNMADHVLHLTITVLALLAALPERYAMPR